MLLGHPPRPISSSQLSSKSQPQVAGSSVQNSMPQHGLVLDSVSKEKLNG